VTYSEESEPWKFPETARFVRPPVPSELLKGWDSEDFEDLEALHLQSAEGFTEEHQNHKLAATLLASTQNLHDLQYALLAAGGDVVSESELLQLTYLHRCTNSLFTVYWATKHHQYSSATGRLRFVLEGYLSIRLMNKEKDSLSDRYSNTLSELKERGPHPHEDGPFVDLLSEFRNRAKKEFFEQGDMTKNIYNHLSNFGSHPHALQSSWHDGRRSDELESDILEFACVCAYAIAAQYVRTFRSTELSRDIEQTLNDTFVEVVAAVDALPTFLADDLEFGPPHAARTVTTF